MNILILSPGYPGENSFTCSFVKHQAVALSKFNHNLFVVSFTFSNKFAFKNCQVEIEASEKIKVYKIVFYKNFPIFNFIKSIVFTYLFVKKHVLKKNKIDVVHSHFFWPTGIIALLIKRKRSIPFVITSHEGMIHRAFKSVLHKYLIKKIIKKADAIISVGKAKLEILKKISGREIQLVHNVVDTDFFKNNNATFTTDDHGQVNIGFLGMLEGHGKGLDVLLKAIALLKEYDVFLHIGGHGKYQDYYSAMTKDLNLADKVKFYGMIKYHEVPEFYKKFDFFILPSRGENNPTVIIEAMAAGLPVISTNCGGPEFMITKENGIIVPPDNIEELHIAIKNMIENLKGFNRDKIVKYAENYYGEKVICSQLTQIYNNIVNTQSGF